MILSLFLIILMLALSGRTGECDNPDGAWLLCEDFETGSGEWDTWWASTDFLGGPGNDDRGRITLSSNQAHSGSFSIYMPADATSNYQGGSLDWVACDGEQKTNCSMRSFDQLYFRVWIRFADDHRYVHHFLNVGGSQPDDYWYHGTAGCLPNGELHMGTTVDFHEESHESFFYTYFPEMSCDTRCDRYMNVPALCQECAEKGLPTCNEQEQCCWGNLFAPATPFAFPVGEWFCFEMMMHANTPNEHDGEMAYWVNDSLIHKETGLMWRTSPTLVMNRVRLQHYITTNDAQGYSNKVWFDDVVVSTERIGSFPGRVVKKTSDGKRFIMNVTARLVSSKWVDFSVVVPKSAPVVLTIYNLSGEKIWSTNSIDNDNDNTRIIWKRTTIQSISQIHIVTLEQNGQRIAKTFYLIG